MYKIVQDPINGPIKIDGIFLELINSFYFQRLRYVKQLGLCNLVFPGANHTRFEHSLGTMFMANEISNYLNIKDEKLQISALLHDIGHTPFSHGIEDEFYSVYNVKHEDLTEDIINGKNDYYDSNIPDILEKYGYDKNEIAKLATGSDTKNKLLSVIISGSMDVDELDYLRRDSIYCGVTIGNIDYKRIFNTIKIEDDTIIGEEKSVPTIESAIISRVIMYKSVYFHKTCRIAQKMIGKSYLLNDDKNKDDLKMNDFEFMNKLLNNDKSKNLIKKILSRDLYKIVYKSPYTREKYDEISDKINGFNDSSYIIDIIPPLYFDKKSRLKNDFIVYDNNKKYEINKVSDIVNSLNKDINKRSIIVSTDKDNYDKIRNLF